MGDVNLGRYHFRSAWHLDLETDALFDVLRDIASYPRWWRQIRCVNRIDDDSAWVVCRSLLPYDLRLRACREREDRAAGVLQVRLSGDLNGWSRWRVAPSDAGTSLVYEQEVVVRTRVLRWVGLIARPVLRLNHAWMMRRGRRGLDRWVYGVDA